MAVTATGFEVFFTTPLADKSTPAAVLAAIKVESWSYIDSSQYGSEETDKRPDAIKDLSISTDRKSVKLTLDNFGSSACVNRMYWIQMMNAHPLLAPATGRETLEAYYTVRAVPH